MNRLKELRERRGLLQSDVADILEMSSVGYGYYEADKRVMPTSKAKKLADFYNVSVDYLLGSDENSTKNIYMIKVYGRISAGLPNFCEENIIGVIPIDIQLTGISNPEELFYLQIHGESMNQIVKNGAYALIRRQDSVDNGDIAVVLVDDEATIKKVQFQDDMILLVPVSSDDSFKTQVYTQKNKIKILGKYIGKFELN